MKQQFLLIVASVSVIFGALLSGCNSTSANGAGGPVTISVGGLSNHKGETAHVAVWPAGVAAFPGAETPPFAATTKVDQDSEDLLLLDTSSGDTAQLDSESTYQLFLILDPDGDGPDNGDSYNSDPVTLAGTGGLSEPVHASLAGSTIEMPTLLSTDPADGADSVSTSLTEMTLTFDQSMSQSTWSYLRNFSRNDATTDWQSTDTFRLQLSSPLLSGTYHRLTLNPSGYNYGFVAEDDGYPCKRDVEVGFTTAEETTPPALNSGSCTPADGATVPTSLSEIILVFDQAMVNAWSISWSDLGDYRSTATDALEWISTDRLRIKLDDPLPASTTFTIHLNPSGHPMNFENGSGTELGENTAYSFTTSS